MTNNEIALKKKLELLKEKYKKDKKEYIEDKLGHQLIVFVKLMVELSAFGFSIFPILLSTEPTCIFVTIVLSTFFIAVGAEMLPEINREFFKEKENIKQKGEILKNIKEKIKLIEELIKNNNYTLDNVLNEAVVDLEKNNESKISEDYLENYDVSLNYNIPNISRKRSKNKNF